MIAQTIRITYGLRKRRLTRRRCSEKGSMLSRAIEKPSRLTAARFISPQAKMAMNTIAMASSTTMLGSRACII